MSKKIINNGSWTQITTTTIPTLISCEVNTVRVYIGDTSEVPLNDGHVLKPNEGLVIPAGLVVSATAPNSPGTIIYTPYGV